MEGAESFGARINATFLRFALSLYSDPTTSSRGTLSYEGFRWFFAQIQNNGAFRVCVRVANLNRYSSESEGCKVPRSFPLAASKAALSLRRCFITALGAAVALFSAAAISQTGGDGEAATPQTYPYIFIATADGAEVWPLVKGRGPAWSSYGERLAFFRESESFRDGTVYVIDQYGHYGYPIDTGIEPAWSPNGVKLLYTGAEGIARLAGAQSEAGTTLIRHDFLTGLAYSEGGTDASSDMGVGKAAWSPDSLQIAFEHLGDGDLVPAQIYLMNAGGREVQRLSTTPGLRYAESDPAWSPDGSSIAFWSYGHGLAVMQLANRSVRTLYKDFPRVAYGAGPAWSPDGSTIAFVVRDEHSGEPAIWLVESAGGTPWEFIPNAYDPEWSPDGSYIAFVSDLAGPAPEPVFHDVPDAVSIYTRESPEVSPIDSNSRYVLFADGKFELQYAFADKEGYYWTGSYVRTGLEIDFALDANWDWQSTGLLSTDGRTLTIAHPITMILDGFEDGVYELDVQNLEEPIGPEEPTDPEGPVKEPDEPRDPPIPLPPEAECRLRCSPIDDPGTPLRRIRH